MVKGVAEIVQVFENLNIAIGRLSACPNVDVIIPAQLFSDIPTPKVRKVWLKHEPPKIRELLQSGDFVLIEGDFVHKKSGDILQSELKNNFPAGGVEHVPFGLLEHLSNNPTKRLILVRKVYEKCRTRYLSVAARVCYVSDSTVILVADSAISIGNNRTCNKLILVPELVTEVAASGLSGILRLYDSVKVDIVDDSSGAKNDWIATRMHLIDMIVLRQNLLDQNRFGILELGDDDNNSAKDYSAMDCEIEQLLADNESEEIKTGDEFKSACSKFDPEQIFSCLGIIAEKVDFYLKITDDKLSEFDSKLPKSDGSQSSLCTDVQQMGERMVKVFCRGITDSGIARIGLPEGAEGCRIGDRVRFVAKRVAPDLDWTFEDVRMEGKVAFATQNTDGFRLGKMGAGLPNELDDVVVELRQLYDTERKGFGADGGLSRSGGIDSRDDCEHFTEKNCVRSNPESTPASLAKAVPAAIIADGGESLSSWYQNLRRKCDLEGVATVLDVIHTHAIGASFAYPHVTINFPVEVFPNFHDRDLCDHISAGDKIKFFARFTPVRHQADAMSARKIKDIQKDVPAALHCLRSNYAVFVATRLADKKPRFSFRIFSPGNILEHRFNYSKLDLILRVRDQMLLNIVDNEIVHPGDCPFLAYKLIFPSMTGRPWIVEKHQEPPDCDGWGLDDEDDQDGEYVGGNCRKFLKCLGILVTVEECEDMACLTADVRHNGDSNLRGTLFCKGLGKGFLEIAHLPPLGPVKRAYCVGDRFWFTAEVTDRTSHWVASDLLFDRDALIIDRGKTSNQTELSKNLALSASDIGCHKLEKLGSYGDRNQIKLPRHSESPAGFDEPFLPRKGDGVADLTEIVQAEEIAKDAARSTNVNMEVPQDEKIVGNFEKTDDRDVDFVGKAVSTSGQPCPMPDEPDVDSFRQSRVAKSAAAKIPVRMGLGRGRGIRCKSGLVVASPGLLKQPMVDKSSGEEVKYGFGESEFSVSPNSSSGVPSEFSGSPTMSRATRTKVGINIGDPSGLNCEKPFKKMVGDIIPGSRAESETTHVTSDFVPLSHEVKQRMITESNHLQQFLQDLKANPVVSNDELQSLLDENQTLAQLFKPNCNAGDSLLHYPASASVAKSKSYSQNSTTSHSGQQLPHSATFAGNSGSHCRASQQDNLLLQNTSSDQNLATKAANDSIGSSDCQFDSNRPIESREAQQHLKNSQGRDAGPGQHRRQPSSHGYNNEQLINEHEHGSNGGYYDDRFAMAIAANAKNRVAAALSMSKLNKTLPDVILQHKFNKPPASPPIATTVSSSGGSSDVTVGGALLSSRARKSPVGAEQDSTTGGVKYGGVASTKSKAPSMVSQRCQACNSELATTAYSIQCRQAQAQATQTDVDRGNDRPARESCPLAIEGLVNAVIDDDQVLDLMMERHPREMRDYFLFKLRQKNNSGRFQ